MNCTRNVAYLNFIFFSILTNNTMAATVILPASPSSGTVYTLPGVYGAAGDNFILNSTFTAPNGNVAVTINGLSTFTLGSTGVINQASGGASGIGSLRAIVLAKAGATIINSGAINGNDNSTVQNTFGMVANSVASGYTTRSASAYNYGTITMAGYSTDGMHAGEQQPSEVMYIITEPLMSKIALQAFQVG